MLFRSESPAFKAFDADYPASKKQRLEAIKETVPVYQGRFKIMRDVTLATDARVKPALNAKGDLEITGKFHYQACDDKVCYPPRDVPVKWTVHYAEVDRQRAPEDLQRKKK